MKYAKTAKHSPDETKTDGCLFLVYCKLQVRKWIPCSNVNVLLSVIDDKYHM